MKRRQFLSSAAAAAVLSSHFMDGEKAQDGQVSGLTTAASSEAAASRIPRVSTAGTMRGEMLYRDLGSTGIQVSVIGLGGSHLGQANVTEDEAVRLIHEGLDRGINFLDNSWDYNEGRSEEQVGKALSQAATDRRPSS